MPPCSPLRSPLGAAGGDGGSGDDGATKTLKVGQPATVTNVDFKTKAKATAELTPTSIEKRSIAVCVTNVGSGDLSKTDLADSGDLTAVDERDESQFSVGFIGDFDRCKSADAQASLKQGESYGTCLAFLIPEGGGSLAKMRWSSGDVSWKP